MKPCLWYQTPMGAVVQTFVFDSECSEQLKVDLIGGEAPVTVHLAKQAHKPIYIAFDSGSDKPKDSSKKPEEILMSRKLRGAWKKCARECSKRQLRKAG